MDLAQLDDDAAETLVAQLVAQLTATRAEEDRLQRRAVGIRKMIDGLVEMFPATEDLLPENLDDDEEPRPRGAEAVRRALDEHAGEWYAVPHVADLLARRGWLPNSSKPSNAVRTALERLVEQGDIEKGRSTEGIVIYRRPEPPKYDTGEEPF